MYPAHWAAVTPDKPAVIAADDGETISYADLDLRSRRLANHLRAAGLEPGGHLAVLLDNTPRFFEILWGALLAGLRVTPVSSHATADDIRYLITDSGARAFVTSDRFATLVADMPSLLPECRDWLMIGDPCVGFAGYDDALAGASDDPVAPDAPLGEYMLYSSGTTGRPKGVRRAPSNRTVGDGSIANRMVSKLFGVDENAVYLSPAPLYHGAPLGFTMAVTSLGGTVVILRKFDAQTALRAIDRFRVTHSQWVPTMFVRMLALDDGVREGAELTSHRVAIHSAAPCPRHVKEQMLAWWGPILHEYYSGTEDVGITYAGPREWLAHPGTVGRALGCTVHICDEDGSELPTGRDGLVFFERPGHRFSYHGDDAKTRSSRHPRHPDWATLGDIGHLDDDGYLYLTDRATFMIISGGVNIYPREVEDVLLTHPQVADVAVIGVPNADFGEEVKAIVEPTPGADPSTALEDDLMAFARANLSGPKRPRTIDFVDVLPRLPTGKLAKHELRERHSTTPTTGDVT